MMRMLPAVEMGFFNLLTVHYCSHKKYSNTITAVALCLVTLFFLALISVFNLPFTGNGKYSLGGLLYLIPLKYLYREKFSRLFVIVCMSWVYTYECGFCLRADCGDDQSCTEHMAFADSGDRYFSGNNGSFFTEGSYPNIFSFFRILNLSEKGSVSIWQ